ncbi:ORF6N domain-containing protein [Algoriphagus taiwanensis]
MGTSSSYGGRRTLPLVFTEQGIAMLSAVLKTEANSKYLLKNQLLVPADF